MEMQNKNALLFNHSISSKLQLLCKPFFDHTGVNSFAYVKFFNYDKGNKLSYLDIATNCDWLEFYFEKLDCTDHVREDIKKTPLNGFYISFWNDTESEENLNKFAALHHFDMWHGMSLYFKTETDCESWHFATTKENLNIKNIYINNIDLINKFVLYFRSNIKDIIGPLDPSKLAVLQKDIDFMMDLSSQNEINILKEKLTVDRVYFDNKNNFHLSLRELKSLELISLGNTIKEAAIKLNISPRTIESYLDNIKDKTGLNTKSQLRDLYFSKCCPISQYKCIF